MSALVSLSNVGKSYGAHTAVRDVSFELGERSVVALVGHNGAGKTTIMKMMLGLVRPSAGALTVLGENPATGQFSARERLGFLPETVAFNGALTGRETLTFFARLKRQPKKAVDLLLERVGLIAAADRRVDGYSKGMRQRLGLAQALLGDPRVLLLDEPTTGLDPALRSEFYAIVAELRDRGATALLSSHALSELETRADRILIMHEGVLVADGGLDELRRASGAPTRIRITMGAGAGQAAARFAPFVARQIDDRAIEIVAGPREKLDILRRATELGDAVEGIDFAAPTLDEIYVGFLRARRAAA